MKILILLFFVSNSIAIAEDDATQSSRTVIDFSDVRIQSDLKWPQRRFFEVTKTPPHHRFISARQNFLPELLMSVNRL